MIRSLGLDLSTTSTGAVVLGGKLHTPAQVLLAEPWKPPIAKQEMDFIDRGGWIADRLLGTLKEFTPDVVVIEGYSYGSNNMEPAVTVGTIIRYFLRQSGYHWFNVAPQALKSFVGHKGKGKPKAAVKSTFNWTHASNDVVDAYVLAQIGLAKRSSFWRARTPAQLEVLSKLKET